MAWDSVFDMVDAAALALMEDSVFADEVLEKADGVRVCLCGCVVTDLRSWRSGVLKMMESAAMRTEVRRKTSFIDKRKRDSWL